MLARKPAPVMVTYLGYPNTTGISTMDARFVDSITDPPPLADSLADPAYDRVGSVVTASFQVYQQKLAAVAGKAMASVAPSCDDLMKRVFALAEPLRPARRGLLVQNKRGPNP